MGSHVEAAVRLSHVFPQSMPQVQFWPGQLLAPPPHGPANVGVMLVVLPVTLPDLALRSKDRPGSSVLMPDSFGYSGDHAVYFGTSVLILSGVLWWLGSRSDQRIARTRSGGF